MQSRVPVVLLVEDDPGDVLMITETFERAARPPVLHRVEDGQEGLDFLYRKGRYATVPRPDLILLDLNMPRLDGRQLLDVIKADTALRAIPVVVFTTSDAEADVLSSYQRHANAYVTKPIDLAGFETVIDRIERFYTATSALLPLER
ncbi:response regulator [Kineosporia babensis]|uniref:Response regulator n=1 Tax=Kineosporia babensis TaxID=499548 RepID=A0A9X1NF91_9ACTN|nr:response regulator [Kineosporia babensis]MCD5312794.1 response regulator [Kineosporia babensis]